MSQVQPANFEHLKQRYSFNKVCEIFEVHETTLRRWMKDGVPLPNGENVRLPFIPLGPRKTVFEKEEVERVFQAMKAAGRELAGESDEGGEVVPLRGRDSSQQECHDCPHCQRRYATRATRRAS